MESGISALKDGAYQEPISTRMQPADFIRLRFMEQYWILEEGITPEYHVEFNPLAVVCILETAETLQSKLIVLGVRRARYPRVATHLPGPTAYTMWSPRRVVLCWSYEADLN